MPAAEVVAVVSRAAVQPRAAASRTGQPASQRARHHGRIPDGFNRLIVIEIVVIAGSAGTKCVKIARPTGTMREKNDRSSLMTSGMTTIIMVMVVQPLRPGWPWGQRPVPTT